MWEDLSSSLYRRLTRSPRCRSVQSTVCGAGPVVHLASFHLATKYDQAVEAFRILPKLVRPTITGLVGDDQIVSMDDFGIGQVAKDLGDLVARSPRNP